VFMLVHKMGSVTVAERDAQLREDKSVLERVRFRVGVIREDAFIPGAIEDAFGVASPFRELLAAPAEGFQLMRLQFQTGRVLVSLRCHWCRNGGP
jgi:hypothetical protein